MAKEEPIPPLRVYIGSGGSPSKTARELTKQLRSHGVYVSSAKDFVDDVEEAKTEMRNSHTAIIVIGMNPLALVEGGVCLGVGVGSLWVAENDQATPLIERPMTMDQALSTIAEIKQGYEDEVKTVRESAKALAVPQA